MSKTMILTEITIGYNKNAIRGEPVTGRLHNRLVIGSDSSCSIPKQCQRYQSRPTATTTTVSTSIFLQLYQQERSKETQNADSLVPVFAERKTSFGQEKSLPLKKNHSNLRSCKALATRTTSARPSLQARSELNLYDDNRDSIPIECFNDDKDDQEGSRQLDAKLQKPIDIVDCSTTLRSQSAMSQTNYSSNRDSCGELPINMKEKPFSQWNHPRALQNAAVLPSKRKRKQKEVTFAGFPTLVMKQDRIDKVFCMEFLDAVTLSYVRPICAYSKRERQEIWYTRAEEETMRKQAFIEDRIQIENSISKSANADSVSTQASTMNTARVGERYLYHRRYRNHYKQAAVDAVLQEQIRQHSMCRIIYGKRRSAGRNSSNSHYSSGILDPERLRKVYRSRGKTIQSQKAAETRAQRYLVLGQCNEPANNMSWDDDRHGKTEEGFEDENEDEHSYHDSLHSGPTTYNFRCCSEISEVFENCINCFFDALLTPILGCRKRSMFLDLGEELVVLLG